MQEVQEQEMSQSVSVEPAAEVGNPVGRDKVLVSPAVSLSTRPLPLIYVANHVAYCTSLDGKRGKHVIQERLGREICCCFSLHC